MFIIYFVDFKNNAIPTDIKKSSHFKESIVNQAKKDLAELRKIDNVIRELLRDEDFDYQKHIGIYAVKDLENMKEFTLDFGEYSFLISKEHLNLLIQGHRFLYISECTIFVPVLSSPKWVKGLIMEKDFELQIFAPGFTLEDEKFHLEVYEYNSNQRVILEKISRGRLLVLYTLFSQLNY